MAANGIRSTTLDQRCDGVGASERQCWKYQGTDRAYSPIFQLTCYVIISVASALFGYSKMSTTRQFHPTLGAKSHSPHVARHSTSCSRKQGRQIVGNAPTFSSAPMSVYHGAGNSPQTSSFGLVDKSKQIRAGKFWRETPRPRAGESERVVRARTG